MGLKDEGKPMVDAPELDLALLETLYVDGVEIPFMDFGPVEPVLQLRLEGREYAFRRSYPRRGFGAVLGKDANDLLDEGKNFFVARFGDRHYLFVRYARRSASSAASRSAGSGDSNSR